MYIATSFEVRKANTIKRIGLFLVFVFDYIPKSDDYLQNKYGEQFTLYKQKTKKLIPFIW
ncbi:hypothetical protein COJ86_28070 [Bacillus cereus]|nr:hypothetical protein COJ86_28070 [Bacillus cereus]